MTPIQSVPKTKTRDFGGVNTEHFWLKTAAASAVPLQKDYLASIEKFLDSGMKDGLICVFTEELSSKTVCETLTNACNNGNRVYILTNSYHDAMKNLGGCLVRYGGGRRMGSFILANPNSNNPAGCFFTGLLSDGSLQYPANIFLALESEQVQVLYRYFCYQFWNKTEKERIGSDEHKTDAAPVDIFPPHEDFCDFKYLQSTWSKAAQNARVTTGSLTVPYLGFDSLSDSEVLTLISPQADVNLVQALHQKNNKVIALDDVSLVSSVKTADGIWLIPKIDASEEQEVYALRLNDTQAHELEDHIKKTVPGKNQYIYNSNIPREQLAGKTIFNLGDKKEQEYMIKPEGQSKPDLPAPTKLLPKETFDQIEPKFDDDGKSVLIQYEWTVKPFTLPAGSSRHKLYQDWQDTQKKISGYIDLILADISENEKKENTLSNKIKGFFLGKQQKFSENRTDLKKLKAVNLGSCGDEEIWLNIGKINEIRTSVQRASGEIQEEERKARLQEKIEALGNEKQELESRLDAKKQGLKETEEEIKTLSESLVKDKEEKLKGLKVKQEYILRETEKNIKGLPASADKEKKVEVLRAKQNSLLRDIENKRKGLSVSVDKDKEKKLDDLQVKKNRQENEVTEADRQVKNKSGEIKNLEDQLKQSGNTKNNVPKNISSLNMPAGKDKNKQPGNTAQTLDVPKLARLPATGELYQQNGRTYLAIAYWEEYDEGKKEAQRLQAVLCAKGEK